MAHLAILASNERYTNRLSRQNTEVDTGQTPRTSYTELVTLSKQQDKEVSNTHHARCKNASRVRLEKHRNTSTHGR